MYNMFENKLQNRSHNRFGHIYIYIYIYTQGPPANPAIFKCLKKLKVLDIMRGTEVVSK